MLEFFSRRKKRKLIVAGCSYVDDYDVRGKYVRGIRSFFDLSHRGCHIIAKLFANIEVSDSKSTCDLFHSF